MAIVGLGRDVTHRVAASLGLVLPSLAIGIGVAIGSGVFAPPKANAADQSDPTGEVESRLLAYLRAFNSGDAAKVVPFWAKKAVSLDEETGERIEGRKAIAEQFRVFFANQPDARLTGRIDSVRLLRPDVAIAEGAATLFTADAEPTPSAFTAVMVKEAGAWVIESSAERELPSPSTPSEALRELEWLVGDWHDETEGVDVNTTVRWSANRVFLIRSFKAEYGDGAAFEGTQVIGWDPRAKRHRTWTFNSDGSFGEGVMSRSGDDWLIRLSHTLGDGSVAAGTHVLTRVDADTMRVQKIGQTVAGVPVESGEAITVVRVTASTPNNSADTTTDAGAAP